MKPTSAYIHEPDGEHPGWYTWELADKARFNPAVIGRMIIRREGEHGARLRMLDTQVRHSNLLGAVHGGVTLALVDIAMFATIYVVLGADAAGSVTLDLNCQFIGTGNVGGSLDVSSEVMKETGRLVFVRGTVEQPQGLVASYMGTLRKPTQR